MKYTAGGKSNTPGNRIIQNTYDTNINATIHNAVMVRAISILMPYDLDYQIFIFLKKIWRSEKRPVFDLLREIDMLL